MPEGQHEWFCFTDLSRENQSRYWLGMEEQRMSVMWERRQGVLYQAHLVVHTQNPSEPIEKKAPFCPCNWLLWKDSIMFIVADLQSCNLFKIKWLKTIWRLTEQIVMFISNFCLGTVFTMEKKARLCCKILLISQNVWLKVEVNSACEFQTLGRCGQWKLCIFEELSSANVSKSL